MTSSPWRDSIWSDLNQDWDVIVIGGGIVGAGVFREAARIGLRTLLVEAHDFSSGTSSRSSKMVHGGLRYLKNGQLKLTMESVHERQRLIREGKGLVDPLEIMLVSYRGDHPPGWIFGLGLIVYDTLALRWEHEHRSTSEIKSICPEINQQRLIGGFRFFDAQTDDARLVLRVIQEGRTVGGVALNYARVEGLLRNHAGRVSGIQLKDMAGDHSVEIKAGLVINATGAWADVLRGQVGKSPKLRLLRGSHLVFPKEKLPINENISFLHPYDRRPVFAFPWEGVTLVGTTDVDHQDPMSTDPVISSEEVNYLLAGANEIFGCLGLTLSDLQATMSGVRSVLDTGKTDPSKEARDEILWDENGLVTITGGKLTMYQHMARRTLRFARQYLPPETDFKRKSRALDRIDTQTLEAFSSLNQLSPIARLRLIGRYGNRAPCMVAQIQGDQYYPVANTATLWAELQWAAQEEQVVHLEDLLLRRTRLGIILPHGAADYLPHIRRICQPLLKWNNDYWEKEEWAYRRLWQQSYSLPQPIIIKEPIRQLQIEEEWQYG